MYREAGSLMEDIPAEVLQVQEGADADGVDLSKLF
jgi:hypothetical protein